MQLDPLLKYNNTRVLYKDIKLYMLKNGINKNSSEKDMIYRVNMCIREFVRAHKPVLKVKYLISKYLNEIEYPLE